MPSAFKRIQQLKLEVTDALKLALRLTDELAKRGDPKTDDATIAYHQLNAVQVQLFDIQHPPSIDDLAALLAETARLCTGALAPLKAGVDRLAAIARG